jgi:uncharacterized protein YrzB (UPF0473 family)
MENDISTIVLTDENGEEKEFDVVTKLDIENKEYVIVIPSDEDEVDAIALRIDKDENGEEVLVTIDDEDEFAMVSEAYELVFSDEDLN